MQTIKIEVKLDGEELNLRTVADLITDLLDKDSLYCYSISLNTDGKESQTEWDCPEL